jgi:DNA-binding HxlR family transcriptional regulator
MLDYKNLPDCPVQTCLNLISDKWKILILRDLMTGTKRFSQLKKSLTPITQKMLTQQLREMEGDGIVHREVYACVPPKVEYSLTELGESLTPVIDAMRNWGIRFKEEVCRKCS